MAKLKKIFITGGEGFIGSHLADKLLKLGHEVVSFDANLNSIDNPAYHQRSLKIRKKIHLQPAKKHLGDIRDLNRLTKRIKDFKPEIVVHLAGLPMARVHDKFQFDMLSINMQGTLNVLEAFEKSSATRIVYTSSSMAYGHFKQFPQTEEFLLNPINSYGATKAAGEYFVKLSKKEWVVVRPTSVYGFTDCANRVSQILLDMAYLKKSGWVVKGETLDFSYIDDVVDGYVKCILQPKASFQTFNISRGESRAVTEFAEIVKLHFPDFDYEVRDPKDHQVWRGPLDISHAKKVLKFNPKYNIETGIKKTLRLIKEFNFYSFQ